MPGDLNLTNRVYEAHAKTCDRATGNTSEDEVATCVVDGATGECVKHGWDSTTIEIRCEGCDKVLWYKTGICPDCGGHSIDETPHEEGCRRVQASPAD